ncbi:mitotic-spindle organizing protein 2B isoform X3 [Saimiri boliviensis]|uniref:mitotic-spindle organizing protein 2B isoform X3 n=1 Tax=Saimiri boliviensis TaxID=27679 RepID=UPI003D78B1A3
MAAQGAGPGPGSAAQPGLEAARQKLALRRKKVLSAEEMELYELAQAAGSAIDPDVFKILVDLLKLNVAPLAVFQMLKSMCAGQRLANEPQDPAAVSLPTSSEPETRGRNKGSTALRGALALAEHSSREGSSQRMLRQPIATRLPKAGRPGKSPMRSNT